MGIPETPGFGLYVHWPFCLAKCPYCDFNSHVSRSIDQSAFCSAYLAELRHWAALVPNQPLRSIFFGGGTPSLMAPDTVAAVIDEAVKLWSAEPGIEITLEANPTSVEADRFRAYALAGVNRVSLGVQALNDRDLKFLGRQHTADEALAALTIARAAFDRVSFDLIYARSGQAIPAWRGELTKALSLEPDHLSLYQLTLEPGTPFRDLYEAGRLTVPDQDESAALFEMTQSLCDQAGLPAYEVSNHAVPGAQSRHNLVYWRYGEYVGIGPGAHGRVVLDGKLTATLTPKGPAQWLEAVGASGHGTDHSETIASADQASEYLLMGLRLTEGISQARYGRLAGYPLDRARIADLVDQNLLAESGDRLAATPSGRLVLNHLIGKLA